MNSKLLVKIILITVVVKLLGAAYIYNEYVSVVDLGEKSVSVVIYSGESFGAVAKTLADSGVVDSRLTFKLLARFRQVDRKLTPGRYDFTGENSCRSILDRLEAADFLKIKVTIPEGSTIWQIGGILAEKLEIDSAKLVSLNHSPEYKDRFDIPCLEGYLFPETYFIPWGSDLDFVISSMVKQYRTQTKSLWTDKLAGGLSREEIMIMASIIEAETGRGSERGLVSSVYHNRLRRGIKMDADPTVIYGLGGLDRPLWTRDLRKDTPYNTYMNKGLPPTAINSPGIEAIRAALNPDESEYLFFVADNSGKHHFSRTNAEHNRHRERIKAERMNN